ncbi:pentatricopeptide repeat-containing protein At5g27110-like [Selaginella moellendorffii]|uniref:pentatricopeptide repeat-containing protein At5g27110-like n=1 Tax=Selaginella moellendorffii TaxID=88036 RepID=UPI000D1CF0F7|nr:pentatricopeptide repeat-containing protein At5g27110-like [Selaginella moellendorffii]XP_024545354.1 pentatricopeptide repeat-containing protein At5g27110-like [Selaginella moellendorffii]|eukprot:XP_024545353.1 pentatricopeptide repeat-containing protein At5g27110-like [Selaginella moellendorffii]
MQQDGIAPNKFVLVRVLSSGCSSLAQGKLAHACLSEATSGSDRVAGNAAINMYGKFGCVESAKAVFDRVLERDIITWTLMVSAYAQNGHTREAFQVFGKMLVEGVVPNKVTFLAILNACSSSSQAGFVHRLLFESGFQFTAMVESSLVDAYGKCKNVSAARAVFSSMTDKTNVVTWNAFIRALASSRDASGALQTFRSLLLQGLVPDTVTFINASQGAKTPPEAKYLETCRQESGVQLDIALGNALINMFGGSSQACEARRVFDATHNKNIVSWNAMLSAYSQNGHFEETIALFKQMASTKTVKPDKLTFASVLSSCANLENLREGKLAHAAAVEAGLEFAVPVAATLIQMYSKCHCLEEARDIFSRSPSSDVVAWTVMISAYAQNGRPQEAIALFFRMTVPPDGVAFATALGACASAENLEAGRVVRAQIVELGLDAERAVANAVLDLYGKCAEIVETAEIFGRMRQRDRVSWNTMVAAYARAGHTAGSLWCFRAMQLEGVCPSEVSLVSVLSTYSHAGLVEQGCQCFASIASDYGMVPSREQQGCVVDLLGRAGSWIAEDLIRVVAPSTSSSELWKAVLSACRIHSDVELGECAAACVLEMDPGSDSAHIILSSIYAMDHPT